MASPTIQFKRGNAGIAGTVPALLPGEPAISLNNFDFFIGIDSSVTNNKFFGSHRYWERERSGVKSLNLKLVSDNGSQSINLRSPVSLGATFTYTLPATAIGYSGKVLSTNADGDLSWIDQVNTASIEGIITGIGTFNNNVGFTTTTVSTSSTTGAVTIAGGLGVVGNSYFGSDLNVGGNFNVIGITTFSNTTDNTLGNPDTGAVQIDGGLGINKNTTIGAGLSVVGQSYFIGTATFYGDANNLGNLNAPTIQTTTIKHTNGTQAATIDASGNVVASQNLTVSGDLYVNGTTTQINTTSLTVEDRTIDLGIINGSVPLSNTTWDLGVLFNYYTGGSAKKSAVIWEHGDSRFKFASVLNSDINGTDNNTPQLSVTNFAPIEISALWINDCAGQSQVISCTGAERYLENITIDAGIY